MAEAEGSVTIYSFTSRIKKVEAAFEAAYPGIDLIGYDISSTEQIARLKAENAAGVINTDVVYVSDAPVVLDELGGASSSPTCRALPTACPASSGRRCWPSACRPRC